MISDDFRVSPVDVTFWAFSSLIYHQAHLCSMTFASLVVYSYVIPWSLVPPAICQLPFIWISPQKQDIIHGKMDHALLSK